MIVAWMLQVGFFSAVLFAVYKINELHKQMDELRDDVRAVRDRVEGFPPPQ